MFYLIQRYVGDEDKPRVSVSNKPPANWDAYEPIHQGRERCYYTGAVDTYVKTFVNELDAIEAARAIQEEV